METVSNDITFRSIGCKSSINTGRPPMNQEEFDIKFGYKNPKESVTRNHLIRRLQRLFTPCRSSVLCIKAFKDCVPILRWLPKYSFKNDFMFDVIGGLTVGIMHIPQGIAYASLAEVPAVVGLYTSFFAPLFYMIFGTAKHNSLGSFAVVSLMTGTVARREVDRWNEIHGFAGNDTVDRTSMSTTHITTTLAFTIGIVHLVMGLLRLSFIATYFSDQVVAGFSTAASLHVLVTQLKDILSIPGLPTRSGAGQLLLKLYDIFTHITHINVFTVVISLMSIIFLLIGKIAIAPLVKERLNASIPIPFELILVIVATTLSTLCDFEHKFHLRIVNNIPPGLPGPHLPQFKLMPYLFGDAIGVAAVIFAVHISLAKIFAKKMNYEIDAGQELYALGATAIFSGFFPIYPISCSLGRTLVNVAAGTKTQFSSVFSSCLVMALLLYFGHYVRQLPMCVLSAIIIVSLRGMLQKFTDLKRLYPLSTIDFSIWVVSFVATIGLDVMDGLLISLCYALLTTVFRMQWSQYHTLVNLTGTSDYRDSTRYNFVTCYPGICALRFDSPLLFVNVERFKSAVYKTLNEWERQSKVSNEYGKLKTNVSHCYDNLHNRLPSKSQIIENPVSHHLIIDCSGFTVVDYMGVNVLKEIFSEMQSRRVLVYFAGAKAPVRELFDSSGFHKYVPKENFYPTIHDAVLIVEQRQTSLENVDQKSELSLNVVEQVALTQPLH